MTKSTSPALRCRNAECNGGHSDTSPMAELAERGSTASYGAVWTFLHRQRQSYEEKSPHVSDQHRADIVGRRPAGMSISAGWTSSTSSSSRDPTFAGTAFGSSPTWRRSATGVSVACA
jgi:hypothetical protein